MVTLREPILHPVPIEELKPTQITVGMREVKAKRKAWRLKAEEAGDKAGEFLGNHMVPTIRGPRGKYYVIDHHHLSLALYEEGVKDVLVTTVADLSRLDRDSFWFVMDCHDWMHPFDEEGKRRGYEDIPKNIKDLIDDPYRSLAGELRHVGGYAKDTTPFSEFLWADFLRRRIKRKDLEKDFNAALEKAHEFAKGKDADYLPGWCGPVPE
ncbi:chromosome partitioning protein ParB [Agrobacterium rhizogenes]|uniref:ParB-like protein n=2 Tax=unclassified Rhizobium TaxID=2613769 RepID=A0AAU7SLV8_9HYPH|nr:chromosome partitioning protein ParB [Rhizobium rhizogenes]NTJ80590.1 chromosome partitioning protein ParB [Rhizobium rhizogenes]